MQSNPRELTKILDAQPTRDGAGVKIKRLGGQRVQQLLNPYLMIDEIHSDRAEDYIAGFPEHPHRGFETITYMKTGRMRHTDHMGNEGVIAPGDVQWMSAGAGVLHSEMPEQEAGLLHGFQIWLNLPAAKKMQPASYQELGSHNIVEQALPNNGLVRVIAGQVLVNQLQRQGPLPTNSNQAVFLDVVLPKNQSVELSFASQYPAVVYIYQGATSHASTSQLAIYSPGKTLSLQAGSEGAQLLVLSGQPIAEPRVQYGPFVMNTAAEIEQALQDFNDPVFLRNLAGKNEP